MAHHCKNFIVHCMDFRLGKPMKEYLEKENLIGDCDIVSIAGGTKDLNFVVSQLDISANLHGINNVIISNHTDCGAYGGSSKFASFEEEYEFHIQEMKKAKDVILGKLPSLKVKMLLGKILSSGEVILDNIKYE